MSMFCYQCEQTAKGTACTAMGICGKDPETAALQDLVIHGLKGLAMYAHRANALGAADPETDAFVLKALFLTLTNVNFDAARHVEVLRELAARRDQARTRYEAASTKAGRTPEVLDGPAAWVPAADLAGLVAQGAAVAIPERERERGDVLVGLEELVTYGLKGLAAYADHAQILGRTDAAVSAFVLEALDALVRRQTAEALTGLALRTGEVNLRVMELLDAAHTDLLGHPTPTPVRTTPVAGKAILISGHDLLDLKALLEQTAGKGVNVYTHGEMLPAHGYPELKKHPHLVGNYGGAWQDQRKEFDEFPGAILMTTNCIQKPKLTYAARLFTCGLVGWPGVTHLEDHAFAPVIEAALAAPGFAATEPEKTILVGFGHHAVLGVADKVVEAVKSGAVRHFFLVGGCDGAESGRNYYTDFATKAPSDTIILTLACGKFRFNKQEFGTVAGLPRLLDVGQCNDAYSAIKIAAALANAFGTDVNGLPLSLVLSWFEQKAVVILLTLLHLGIRNIRIGPALPAFLKPPVLQLLVDTFALTPIGASAEEDLKTILAA